MSQISQKAEQNARYDILDVTPSGYAVFFKDGSLDGDTVYTEQTVYQVGEKVWSDMLKDASKLNGAGVVFWETIGTRREWTALHSRLLSVLAYPWDSTH